MSALTVTDLARRYETPGGVVTALDGVSFTIEAGASLAVTGPSGSGKSTLLGLVAGLDRPSAGTISVAGTDLGTLSEDRLASFRGRAIGYVFQSFRLLPGLTALENVRLPLDLAGTPQANALATTWLERVGLGARSHHVPTRLSGGEQQRVALARALVTQPSLVVADEPTGNLDGSTSAAMSDLLFASTREHGAALLLVTHDEVLAERCDRRLRLRDGRLDLVGAR
jgi:putative ABC transport system ATP-binding protein